MLEREKRNDDALRRLRLCIGRAAGLIWTGGPIDTWARELQARQPRPVPSRPVPVWLYVPVRQSYCYIYRIQTIGVAHASTTTASSIAERACSSSSNSSEETVEDGSEQQQQAAAAGAAATTRGLPDGRRGAAGRQRQEAGTPGEDDLARGEGLHRRMHRGALLLLDLRDVLRLGSPPFPPPPGFEPLTGTERSAPPIAAVVAARTC